MKVREVMSPDVVAVARDTGLESLAKLFAAKEISGAPVVREDGTPCGVVSVTDLAHRDEDDVRHRQGYSVYYRLVEGRAQEFGVDSADSVAGRVEDVMSTEIYDVSPDATLAEAGATMTERNVHRLLVIDEGKLVGVVTALDLVRGLSQG